jgi:protein NEDD1
MYDFQSETKAELMGLHLDLVKMGRSWKQELRTLMEEYVGDLSDIREENRRLRAENDRLRRGY